MSWNVIDAKSKFPRHDAHNPVAIEERVEKRRDERKADLLHLRALLQETTRIPQHDRVVVVRNLGRLIERRFPGEQKAWASKLISKAFGKQAESILKKRSRYIRFEGEDPAEGDQLFADRRVCPGSPTPGQH